MIEKGIIVEGIGGLYHVDTLSGRYECMARGVFRKTKQTPMVGDYVDIDTDKNFMIKIYDRKNSFVRPPIANIDKLIITVASSLPQPDFLLVDKLIIFAEKNNVEPILVINKSDQATAEFIDSFFEEYKGCDYKKCVVSAITGEGMDALKKCIDKGVIAFCGQSGVGKSSLLNTLFNDINQETGIISKKLKRGKHTTRSVRLIDVNNAKVMDTPGFSKIDLWDMPDALELSGYYIDFKPYTNCKYLDCCHDKEPECGVKEAVKSGKISKNRYNRYILLLNELKGRKRQY